MENILFYFIRKTNRHSGFIYFIWGKFAADAATIENKNLKDRSEAVNCLDSQRVFLQVKSR